MIRFPHLGYIGRLGNALFQFAATLGLARDMNSEPRFNPDWIHRPYFSVPDEFFMAPKVFDEDISPTDLCLSIDERARVYMQDVRLFEHALPEICRYLRPSALAEDLLSDHHDFDRLKQPILSVHVRRGDNVPGQDPGVPNKQDYYVLPALAYYENAIKALVDDVGSIAVFSDDPLWCERHLGGWADYISHGQPRPKEHEADFLTAPVMDWIDLQLMARCHRHVITGSTFGIWGALLARSEAVVRPTPVYGPNLSYINEDAMFLPSWKVLPVSC